MSIQYYRLFAKVKQQFFLHIQNLNYYFYRGAVSTMLKLNQGLFITQILSKPLEKFFYFFKWHRLNGSFWPKMELIFKILNNFSSAYIYCPSCYVCSEFGGNRSLVVSLSRAANRQIDTQTLYRHFVKTLFEVRGTQNGYFDYQISTLILI